MSAAEASGPRERRAWGSIVSRKGHAYAKVRIGGRRTHRALYLADGVTPCPAGSNLAEEALARLQALLARTVAAQSVPALGEGPHEPAAPPMPVEQLAEESLPSPYEAQPHARKGVTGDAWHVLGPAGFDVHTGDGSWGAQRARHLAEHLNTAFRAGVELATNDRQRQAAQR
jgi:hypothetical protein